MLPNAIPPVIVIATVSLGVFIAARGDAVVPRDRTQPGHDHLLGRRHQHRRSRSLRSNPSVLLYPAVALSITVLSFIMLGDAVREALDPKSRKR